MNVGVDLTGQTIGGAVVLRLLQPKRKNCEREWLCRLPCNHERTLNQRTLQDIARDGRKVLCYDCLCEAVAS